jgi:hypothetical protein
VKIMGAFLDAFLGALGLPRKDVAKKYCQVIRTTTESAMARRYCSGRASPNSVSIWQARIARSTGASGDRHSGQYTAESASGLFLHNSDEILPRSEMSRYARHCRALIHLHHASAVLT